MTYCVGLDLDEGFVLLSDTRTNAGVDNISTFPKMHPFIVDGERVIVLMTAGNLAISQAVVNLLVEGLEEDVSGEHSTLLTVPSMFRAAQLVGQAVRRVWHVDGGALKAQDITFEFSALLAGQIRGRTMRLFQLYAAGNFIEATPDTPFLQIGEHKYGKPILDRAVTFQTPLYDGVKLALISMDSTLRSNLTVGLPIDLLVYRRGALSVELRRRIGEDDAYFKLVRETWGQSLRQAHKAIPAPNWADEPEQPTLGLDG